MEIGEALKLRGQDDLLELFLLAHAEAVAEVARAELAALEFLDNLPLTKGLRQKLGRRRIVQAKDEMHVEIVEERFLLIGTVNAGDGAEILVGENENAPFGAGHGQKIVDAGHLVQGTELIDDEGNTTTVAISQREDFTGHDVDDEGHQWAEDGLVLADVHEKEIPLICLILDERAERKRSVAIGEIAKEGEPFLQ